MSHFAAVGESWELRIVAPQALARFLAYKGSITVNGVSLTVNTVTDLVVEDVADGSEISINLIPHTVAHTTLRGDRMWEFLDRLVSIALPRIRDFRGLSPKQFDGLGNYTFGLTEQSMFHEIDQDRIDRVRGMDITVVTTATNDDEGRALLKQLGFPFKEI